MSIRDRDCVKVWVTERPGETPRLLATIHRLSTFRNTNVLAIAKSVGWNGNSKLDNPLACPKVRDAVAVDIIDGWRRNGPWPQAKFSQEHL